MSTKSKSFAERINGAQVMATGLKSNLSTLKKRGMSAEFITSLSKSLSKVVDLNNKQEKHKAELRATTAAIETSLHDLELQMREAVKVVKLEMPQELWKEFGITAKR